MNQRLIGLVVGSVFGAVFVLVNAQSPLPPGSVAALRVAAVACLAAVVVFGILAARRSGRSTGSAARPRAPDAAKDGAAPRPAMFNRWYLLVVAAEVVLLFAGFPVLRALGAPVEANVAWIALVVGVHFFALAAVWKAPSVLVPGAGLSLLGAAGFVLVGLSMAPLVPIVSGVLSGGVLLGSGIVATAVGYFAARRA